jgi:monoamine oxidase
VDVRTTVLRERLLPAIEKLLPAARTAVVRDFFVTRERHATFRPAPGCAALRPGAASGHPGLHLAGAWTATGWPATMEGAVRSGDAAAAEVLSRQSVAVEVPA